MARKSSNIDTNTNHPIRAKRTMDIHIDEKPIRPVYITKSNAARDKFIKLCEKNIRGSLEYRKWTRFLKENMEFNRCAVLPSIITGNGKKYSIEIHHEPFTLYDLVDIEITKRELHDQPLNVNAIAKSVMALHYDGLVGLIPLSKTQHELIDVHKVFIPLQHIYQDYHKYYEEYEDYININEHIKKKIDVKVALSLKCDAIQSDAASPEFTYLDVEGFKFPELSEDLRELVSADRSMLARAEKEAEKEAKKKSKNEGSANS